MTIGKKISFGFAATIAVTAVTGLVSYRAMTEIRDVAVDVADNSLHCYRAIVGVNDPAQANETGIAQLLDGPDAAGASAIFKDIRENTMGLDRDFAEYRKSTGNDREDAGNFEKLRKLRTDFDPRFARVLALCRAGKLQEARQLFLTECAPVVGDLLKLLNGVGNKREEVTDGEPVSSRREFNRPLFRHESRYSESIRSAMNSHPGKDHRPRDPRDYVAA